MQEWTFFYRKCVSVTTTPCPSRKNNFEIHSVMHISFNIFTTRVFLWSTGGLVNIYSLWLSRQVVAWHRPYCVDLEESTFSHLRSFLERYCDGINSEVPPLPFPSSRWEHTAGTLPSRLLTDKEIYNRLWQITYIFLHQCTFFPGKKVTYHWWYFVRGVGRCGRSVYFCCFLDLWQSHACFLVRDLLL